MSKIILSHVDIDGLSVITLAKHFQNRGLYLYDEIFPCDYGFDDNEEFYGRVSEYNDIVIADLTLNKDKIKNWIDQGKSVKIFDHHSETQWIQDFEGSVWDDTRCGTKIFWEEYLRPQVGRYKPIIDEFVNLVDTYDLWKKDSEYWEDAKNLTGVMYGIFDYRETDLELRQEPYHKLMSKKFNKLNNWRWTEKEKDIIERAQAREQEMYEKAMSDISYREDKKGKLFAVIMIGSKVSVVASRILDENDFLDYLIVINTYGGVTGKLSFRSSRGFVCHDLCVANGHDAASGGQVTPQQAKEFWENEDLSFRYNEDYNKEKPYKVFDGITYL